MGDRHKEQIRRRSVLSKDQVEPPSREAHASPGQRPRKNRSFRRLIPILIFGAVALMIAKQEIPVIDQWWSKTFSPDEWHAGQTCQQAAVSNSRSPEFVRVLNPGKVHRTANGIYLEQLIIGEMGARGTEERISYSCYVDHTGALTKLNRLTGNAGH